MYFPRNQKSGNKQNICNCTSKNAVLYDMPISLMSLGWHSDIRQTKVVNGEF